MRVAVLEDDVVQQKTLEGALAVAGIDAKIFGTGKEFKFGTRRESFDAMVLDWTVPDTTGIEVLRSLRSAGVNVPVLFTTVRDAEQDIIEALKAGADDYMIKPLRSGEMIARLRAIVRRAQPPTTDERVLEYGAYHFDIRSQALKVNGEVVNLTQKEFELGLMLFRNIGKPLSRGHIREEVWGHDFDMPSRTLDTHISRVRTKLNLRPEAGFLLAPVYSYGYRLEDLAAETDNKSAGVPDTTG
ncbi:MAG: response regulator transcription factor [Burkholderiaceae bacterium]